MVLNLMINKGDKLSNTRVWKIKATKNLLRKVSRKLLHSYLLEKGFANSFFKGYIWLCPLSNNEINERKNRKAFRNNFR